MMYLLPQLPCRNRYTEDWAAMWIRELTNLYVKFRIVGLRSPVSITKYFTDPVAALVHECNQIKALTKVNPEKIFCLDVEFPGLLTPAIQALRLINLELKCFGYLHAGNWCHGDIWNSTPGRQRLDRMIFDTYDKVFVATNYHKRKIESYFSESFDNIEVVGFPFYREDVLEYVTPIPFEEKDAIIINGRREQSSVDFWDKLNKKLGVRIQIIEPTNRRGYYHQLNKAKIVISLKTEETFGIGQLEAYVLGGIPLCPNKFAYPEVIGDERLLYSSEEDLVDKLDYLLKLKENPFHIDIEKYEQVISNCMIGF